MNKKRGICRVKQRHAQKSLVEQLSDKYPDTEGMELSDPIEGASYDEQAIADVKEIRRRKACKPQQR